MARILVVDDDAGLLHLYSTHLAQRGHEVLGALDGCEAIRFVDANHPDLIVTDLQMPVCDGFILLAHVQTLPRVLPVILISGSWDDAKRRLADSLGCFCRREKPYALEDLSRDVEAALESRSRRPA